MKNRWKDAEARNLVGKWRHAWGKDLALTVYASRLAGAEPGLVMHGGGNTSLKSVVRNVTGDDVQALFVKASGVSMASIDPDGFVCLDLVRLRKLRRLASLSDATMAGELRLCMLRPSNLLPSIETLMHAFFEWPCIVHTHPNAVLCLTNRGNGEKHHCWS